MGKRFPTKTVLRTNVANMFKQPDADAETGNGRRITSNKEEEHTTLVSEFQDSPWGMPHGYDHMWATFVKLKKNY